LLPPDDERLVRSHVEDRDHGAAAQRIAPAHLGDAIDGSPARPQAHDAASAWPTAHVDLDLPAHVAIRVLDDPRAPTDPGDEERRHTRLQEPAVAPVVIGPLRSPAQ